MDGNYSGSAGLTAGTNEVRMEASGGHNDGETTHLGAILHLTHLNTLHLAYSMPKLNQMLCFM
jgi:L-cysteine desulfidase